MTSSAKKSNHDEALRIAREIVATTSYDSDNTEVEELFALALIEVEGERADWEHAHREDMAAMTRLVQNWQARATELEDKLGNLQAAYYNLKMLMDG